MSNGSRDERWPRRIGYIAAWWAALVALWLLYVTSLQPPEVLAGLVAATLAAFVAVGLRAHGGVRFRPRLRWILLLRAVPWQIPRDSAILAVALWRRLVLREPVRGVFRRAPFLAVDDDPATAAWRAFAIAATSVAPNTYVVGIDGESGEVLIHQLVPTAPAKARSSLVGAAPRAERDRRTA